MGNVGHGKAGMVRTVKERHGRARLGVAGLETTIKIEGAKMVFNLKSNKSYSWKNGFSKPVDANIVGGVIEEIQKRDGCVTKSSFLDASRPLEAPTHTLFEWDDSIAGERWREYQSMHIINSIEVTIIRPDAPEEKSATRAFVVVDKAKDPTKKARLVSVDVALGNEAMRSQVLENALMELKSFKRKYEMLSELSKVFKAIDEVTGNEEDNTE